MKTKALFLKTDVERGKKTESGSFAMSLVRVSDVYPTAVEETYRDRLISVIFKNIILNVGSCR